jgi:hypothetical protein
MGICPHPFQVHRVLEECNIARQHHDVGQGGVGGGGAAAACCLGGLEFGPPLPASTWALVLLPVIGQQALEVRVAPADKARACTSLYQLLN